MYTGRLGRNGLSALEEYKALSLDAEIRHRLGIDDDGSDTNGADNESDDGDDRDDAAAASVVLPYVHEGNAMTASGRAEDFLPISAGGKLKDKNDKVPVRVIHFTERFLCEYVLVALPSLVEDAPPSLSLSLSLSLSAMCVSHGDSHIHRLRPSLCLSLSYVRVHSANTQPGVIFYTRDSDDEVYDSDEDPDDDLDI